MNLDAEGSLYEAAIEGNVSLLQGLLRKDEHLLERVLFGGAAKEHPLHIASQFGNLDFVTEILTKKRELALKLNSRGQTPLHVATEKGHVEVVRELLERNADACFVRDGEGMTPLHVAAMKGRLNVLEELVRVRPRAAWVLTDGGVPILHLCANLGRLEALKFLVEKINDKEFLKLKDKDDNTFLHLLVAKGEYKDIKLLIKSIKIQEDVINSVNINGTAALDATKDIHGKCNRFLIRKAIRKVGGKKGKDLVKRSHLPPKKRNSHSQLEKKNHSSNNGTQEALMVVAILIATVTYQGLLNPPCGVWQDNNNHTAGKAIMSDYFPGPYIFFTICNTVGFLVSLILILLLVSRSSFREGVLKRYFIVMTWIAVSSLLVTYSLSFYALAEDNVQSYVFVTGIVLLVVGWMGFSALLIFVFLLHFINSLLSKFGIKPCGMLSCFCKSCSASGEQNSRQTELQVVTAP